MARGNQRELARQKNLKKQQADGKGRKDDGLGFEDYFLLVKATFNCF